MESDYIVMPVFFSSHLQYLAMTSCGTELQSFHSILSIMLHLLSGHFTEVFPLCLILNTQASIAKENNFLPLP